MTFASNNKIQLPVTRFPVQTESNRKHIHLCVSVRIDVLMQIKCCCCWLWRFHFLSSFECCFCCCVCGLSDFKAIEIHFGTLTTSQQMKRNCEDEDCHTMSIFSLNISAISVYENNTLDECQCHFTSIHYKFVFLVLFGLEHLKSV